MERLKSVATVLDVGCGWGRPVARFLLDRGMRVTGVDTSPSLIAAAQRDFPDAEWIVDDMRSMDLGRRFDAVIA